MSACFIPATLVPYATDTYDKSVYAAMRDFHKPFISFHFYGFYVLVTFSIMHILAVVMTELREGGNLISAMFTGTKVLSEKPAAKSHGD